MFNYRLYVATAAFAALLASPASAASCGAAGEPSAWSCENPIALKSVQGDDDTKQQHAGVDRSARSYSSSTDGNNGGNNQNTGAEGSGGEP